MRAWFPPFVYTFLGPWSTRHPASSFEDRYCRTCTERSRWPSRLIDYRWRSHLIGCTKLKKSSALPLSFSHSGRHLLRSTRILLAGDFKHISTTSHDVFKAMGYLDSDTLVAVGDFNVVNPVVRSPYIHAIRTTNISTCRKFRYSTHDKENCGQ